MTPSLSQRLALRERPSARVIMRQRWEDLWFIHWVVPAEELQAHLPPGLTIDVHEGQAYLGVVPFRMRAIRPVGCPPVPYLSYFLECNVRTYVYDEQGEPGVWFFSLDTDRWLAYKIARVAFRLAYHCADMSFHKDNAGVCEMTVRRRGEKDTGCYRSRPRGSARAAEPGSLEFFLLERYLLYAYDDRGDRLFRGRVFHHPYQFSDGEAMAWSAAPIGWNGLSIPEAPPVHFCHARRVEVSVYPIEKLP